MIIGIGSDILDIRRIERTIERHGDRFLERIFTTAERAKAADAALRGRGLIVRAMGAYDLPHCLRITIGTAEECQLVTDALQADAAWRAGGAV